VSSTDPEAEFDAATQEHRAGWFELFLDLVFVVTVSVAAHGLRGDPGPGAYGTFLVLFFPAWWAWVNLMVTVNVFGPDTTHTRLTLLAAMPALGLMAAATPHGLGDRSWAFALGAAWVRLVLFLLWWRRSRQHNSALPAWRPISYGVVPAALWALSAAVPGPGRYALWAAAITLEVLLLALRSHAGRHLYDELSVNHLVERIGLFVVIVLGEGVFSVVSTLATHFTAAAGAAALAAFVVLAVLAATFFVWGTSGARRGLGRAQSSGATWAIRDAVMYLPFLLIAGLTVLSAALGTAVEQPDVVLPLGGRWALCGGILAFHTANAAISLRYGDTLRTVLHWYLPSPALTLTVLVPAAVLLPAWGAVTVAAGQIVVLAELARRRPAPRPARTGHVPAGR